MPLTGGSPVILAFVLAMCALGSFFCFYMASRRRVEIEPERKIIEPPRAAAPQVSETERRRRAIASIESVKDRYGEAMSDICYVIENHALFDRNFPDTAAFEDQLFLIQDTVPELLDIETLEQRAARFKALFATAQNRAEQVGLKALEAHDPDAARRALGLARKAASTTSENERAVSLERLGALLDVLGIIVPRPAREAIEAGRARALEPTGHTEVA